MSTVDPHVAVIRFFAADLSRAHRILAWHIEGSRGECLGCRSQTRHVESPCLVAHLAEQAVLLLIPRPREAPP